MRHAPPKLPLTARQKTGLRYDPCVADHPSLQPSGPLVFISVLVGFGVLMLLVKPSWQSTNRRARTTECPINLEMIATEQARMAAAGRGYLSCPRTPAQIVGAESMRWQEPPACWARLGFLPDVPLRGRYEVAAAGGGWTATCEIDSDGDGDVAVFDASEALTVALRAGTAD